MSHQKKIEQVLELLINEEHEAASELLHSVIVEKARGLYEELVDEEFGGDEKEDFADEIEADKDEIEADEVYDDEGGEEEDGDADDADEEEIEDRVEDLESEFAELKAEFDALVGGEVEDEMGGEEEFAGDDEGFGDVDFGGEEVEVEGMYEDDDTDLDEATKLQDEQKISLKNEGELTGKGGSAGATSKDSMFTKQPKKADHGGKAHKIGGSDESGKKASQGKDNTPEDNIDVPQKKQSAKAADGDDQGAESILGQKNTPKGA